MYNPFLLLLLKFVSSIEENKKKNKKISNKGRQNGYKQANEPLRGQKGKRYFQVLRNNRVEC
jgi:hypothetical protein